MTATTGDTRVPWSRRADRGVAFPVFDVTGARRQTHFGYGLPDESTFGWPLVRGIPEMVAGAGRKIYQYTDGWGAEELRETLAAMYGRSPGEVLITSGATAAMAVLADALIDPGDAVLVEDPGYLGAIKIFATAGATLKPLSMDSEGVSLVALEEALSLALARLATDDVVQTQPESMAGIAWLSHQEARDVVPVPIKLQDITLVLSDSRFQPRMMDALLKQRQAECRYGLDLLHVARPAWRTRRTARARRPSRGGPRCT